MERSREKIVWWGTCGVGGAYVVLEISFVLLLLLLLLLLFLFWCYRIPEEVWSRNEVNLSYLKVFGCVSYVHIDFDAHSKLDAKSRKYFFYWLWR
jgi:hypothetical protein